MRGSAEYKRHLASELTIRTLRTAVETRTQRPGRGRELAMQVTMTVNGEQVTAEVEPRMLLVHFLRDQLRLTGTHWGCDTSNCGTCVVDMDGEPVKSCTMLAAMASGTACAPSRVSRSTDGSTPCRRASCVPRPAVRVLHARDDDHRPGPAGPQPRPDRGRDPRGDLRPDLPVHRLHHDRAVDPVGGQHQRRSAG